MIKSTNISGPKILTYGPIYYLYNCNISGPKMLICGPIFMFRMSNCMFKGSGSQFEYMWKHSD